ncbi:MAG: hypothetical protein J6O71_06940 [Lachnospiraceae bacterium]|nr:hypothetical protein [Lachnospiraceae bacterium]
MSGPNEELVISIDINDDMTYISYASLKGKGVTTLSSKHDSEKYGVPTLMYFNEDTMKWSFGANAYSRAQTKGGKLYDRILTDVIGTGDPDEEAKKRLSTFLAHSLELAAVAIDKEYMNPSLEALAICLQDIDSNALKNLEGCITPLKSVVKEIRFITRSESFYYYTLSQPPEIWRSSVLLVDYSRAGCVFSHLKIKRGTTYSVAYIDEEQHPEMLPFDEGNLPEMDQKLLDVLKEAFSTGTEGVEVKVSSVYLSGLNLEGNWAKNTLNYLCRGRRVFQGQNLYTKGACYAIRDQLTRGFINKNFVFMSGDKVNYDIGIRMIHKGAEVVSMLSEAGTSWYDLKGEMDVMLGESRDVEIVLKSFPEGDESTHLIRLTTFPERPKRACRANIRIYMENRDELKVEVTDRGLGELIPASGIMVSETINLNR